MAHIVVLGGGIGGVSCAYELKQAIRKEDRITVVSNRPFFQFTPSNPWVAVKWRSKDDITIDLASVLPKHGVNFTAAGTKRVSPAENHVELGDGSSLSYDYLVIATGPELAFDEIEGFGPEHNTNSVCDVDHAMAKRWEEFCKNPGPIVVGAVQGASCYGPAYEFAMIMDADLRKRRIRDKVPITFVTPEPISAISASAALATPRACSNPRCASGTSNGSPIPKSTRLMRTRFTQPRWTRTASRRRPTSCPSTSR
jgi:sulfide:quinone oxidoreductase